MPVTQQDLTAFQEYAQRRISNGGADSMDELFRDWLAKLEQDDVHRAIREGLADVDAGRTRPFRESMDEFRRKHGLPPQRSNTGRTALRSQGIKGLPGPLEQEETKKTEEGILC